MKSKIISAVAGLLLMGLMIPLSGCYDVEGPGWGGGGYPAYSSWYGPDYIYGYGHPWYHDDWGYWGHDHHWDGHDWAARESGWGHGGVGFAHTGGFGHGRGHSVAHSGGHGGGHHRG